MNIIAILDDNVISKIAAGEVIERPASVVKELIENSIDSGADNIHVEVENAGKKKIKITDNGCGMSKEDASICIERHATSKIKDINDLKTISTLGFRGEALSSISSVSNFEIITKNKDSGFGTSVRVNCGKGKIVSQIGCQNGTTIIVKDLFFNVPARLKFLKSTFTEFGHISEVIFKESLSYPDISFKLTHNGQIVYNVLKEDSIENRIILYYGKEIDGELIHIEPEFNGNIIKVSGIISKPSYTRPNRSFQTIFVNKRYVFDKVVANAVSSAYDTLLQKDRHPLVVLFIEINQELVDVNVHPTKREIRFINPSDIHKDVVNAVKGTLEKNNIIKKQTVVYDTDLQKEQSGIFSRATEVKEAIQEYLAPTSSESSERIPVIRKDLLQVHNSYIITEALFKDASGIYIIDQHASHERIIYEEIISQKSARSSLIESQGLLLPLSLHLSSKESNIMEENINYLEELGFEIANLGNFIFSIHAVPRILADKNCASIVKDIISNLAEEKITDKIDAKDKIIKTIACKSAVKANDKLESSQMELIVDKIEKCKIPYCPHGRPAVVFLSLSEINKMFKRE